MTRLLMAAIVALGLAACGGAESEGWVVEGEMMPPVPAIDGTIEAPSPAQKLMVLLSGNQLGEKAATTFGKTGDEGASSPDPMPGRQRDDSDFEERGGSPLR